MSLPNQGRDFMVLPCDEARLKDDAFLAQSLRVLEGLYDTFQEHVEGQ